MPALDILGFENDDILGLDILVHMPTFDIPADILADFPFFDMPALDILVDMPALDNFDLDIPDLGIDDILGLDILVDMPTFDIPADVLADFPILGILVYMPALDILDFEVEDILVLCLEAAAVGSPVCLMLVCHIPAAVGILTRTSLFLGFVLITISNNSDLTQNPANFVFHQPRMLDLLV